jgi:protein tyrosine/serine phosphatase
MCFDMCHKSPGAVASASGKDRTKVPAALLLSVVGVPRETIIGDYTESHEYGLSEEHLLNAPDVAEDDRAAQLARD